MPFFLVKTIQKGDERKYDYQRFFASFSPSFLLTFHQKVMHLGQTSY
jgi:hypothetical protein